MKCALALLFFVTLPAFAADLFGDLHAMNPPPDAEIRLFDVYPSDLPKDVKAYRLLVPKDATNRYGEVLAEVVLADGAWLQEKPVREGIAMVMPVYETNEARLSALVVAEDEARKTKTGLWRKSPVVCAPNAKKAFESFAIIHGRPLEAASVRGTIYLNFGEDYRKDFTVKIGKTAFAAPPQDIQDEITRLMAGEDHGKSVEVRGWVFYSGGPLIEVRSSASLRFLEDDSDLKQEKCTVPAP